VNIGLAKRHAAGSPADASTVGVAEARRLRVVMFPGLDSTRRYFMDRC